MADCYFTEYCEKEGLPIIGPQKGNVLVRVLRKVKHKHVLEVGTLIGYSAILIGKELENNAQLITIEIDEDKAKIAKENIEAAGIKAKIKVIVGDALDILPKLEGKFNLIFLDAAKKEYMKYLRLIEDNKLLHKESVIVADNAGLFAESMRDYLDHVRSSKKYKSDLIPVGNDGLEISIKI